MRLLGAGADSRRTRKTQNSGSATSLSTMAQVPPPLRTGREGAGVAPLDGEATGRAVPVLDNILPIPDSALKDYESQRYVSRWSDGIDAIDINLDQVEELLSKPVAPDERASHVATVRAQLDSVVRGLTPPPRPPEDAAAAPAVQLSAPVAPPKELEAPSRLSRQLARQVVVLTLRAEAAESRLRALEAERAAERETFATLGRRFGQWAHESFPVFVARLGMMAKAGPTRRGPGGTGSGES